MHVHDDGRNKIVRKDRPEGMNHERARYGVWTLVAVAFLCSLYLVLPPPVKGFDGATRMGSVAWMKIGGEVTCGRRVA